MKNYIGIKEVKAVRFDKMSQNPTEPPIKGYKVVYDNGYESWSPKEVFEEAYHHVAQMPFEAALHAVKDDFAISRHNWNAPGQYVKLRRDSNRFSGEVNGDYVDHVDHLVIKTSNNFLVPWFPSATDILANDWYIVGFETEGE